MKKTELNAATDEAIAAGAKKKSKKADAPITAKEARDNVGVAKTASAEKRRQTMMELRSHVQTYMNNSGIEVEWVPVEHLDARDRKAASFVDYHHHVRVNGYRINEFYLISLINAYLLSLGVGYRYNETAIFLHEWIISQFPFGELPMPEKVTVKYHDKDSRKGPRTKKVPTAGTMKVVE